MPAHSTEKIVVNGRHYALPDAPVAVICMDGCSDAYLDWALLHGRMPHLKRMIMEGFRGQARSALPSFTNVNNASLITGVPPSLHGISGNYFFDESTQREVMMNSSDYLRAQTIAAVASDAGRKVAVVTAKEKLRDILSHRLWGIAFSAENAKVATRKTHGIEDVEQLVGKPAPSIYSPDASLYVLKAGVALVQQGRADFLYLSLTDYVQHKWAPEEPEAIAFMAGIDVELGKLLDCGAIIGATADHGMNSKQTPWGEPNVIYLETLLQKDFGPGFRVILPITDPYVIHHGALGSFATVYLPPGISVAEVKEHLLQIDELTEVYDRPTAARKLELPEDRIGDLVVMSRRDVAIGRTPEYHDLSVLSGKLRSHGGRYEETVPFIVSKPLTMEYQLKAQGDLRNFDIFDFTLNGVQPV